MGNWHHKTIGDLLTLQRGIDLPESERQPGSVPVMGSFGVTGRHSKAVCKGPGVTVGRSGGSAGVVSYIEEDYWPLNTCLYVRDFKGNHPRFCYYFLKTFDLARLNSGSAQPSLNRNFVHPVLAVFPDPPEQAAIASVLSALDDKIALNDAMNVSLEATARTIFNDSMVEFGPTRAKIAGHSPYLAPDFWSLFPDKLDGNVKPAGWGIGTLEGILVELETGGRPKGGVATFTAGVPSIGAESIVGLGKFDFRKTKYIPDHFFESMNKGHVKARDVLLYKDGGKPGLFEPHVTLVGEGFPFDTFAINEHVYRLRAQQWYGQNCLYFWLSSDAVKSEMRIKGTGVAIPGLNSAQVKSLATLTPTPDVSQCLDAILEPFVHRVLSNSNESRLLAQTRDFLLPRLMSGDVRVRDAEKILEDSA